MGPRDRRNSAHKTYINHAKTSVLPIFLCTGNSCRSQMAEGLLREMAGDRFEAASAGTKPVGLNPLTVQAMAELDLDISGRPSRHVDSTHRKGLHSRHHRL